MEVAEVEEVTGAAAPGVGVTLDADHVVVVLLRAAFDGALELRGLLDARDGRGGVLVGDRVRHTGERSAVGRGQISSSTAGAIKKKSLPARKSRRSWRIQPSL